MSKKLVRNLTVIVGLLLITVFVFGAVGYSSPAVAASPANPAAAEDLDAIQVVSNEEFLSQGTAERKPWTLERMANAIPADVMVVDGPRELSVEPVAAGGDLFVANSNLPGDAKLSFAAEEDLDLFSGVSPLGYSYPAPYTRYNFFTSYKKWPFHVAGVLFYSNSGFDYRCTAESIGNYAIWTAGHCVHGGGMGGTWSYDFVFVPGYADGRVLKGVWYGDKAWSLVGWTNNGDLSYDMGGIILYTSGGQRISQVVGNFGFIANASRQLAWYAIGWPAAAPFDGRWQTVCASSFAYTDTSMSPYTTGIGCDMTGGSSGGPWLYKFAGKTGLFNLLNGNNSYRYVGWDHEMFTPYFGNGAVNLWNALIADTP
jgi:V8-like Glu-specific endopeptidase